MYKKKKAFCEFCYQEQDYEIKHQQLMSCINQQKFHFSGKVAYCLHCHQEISIHELTDFNLHKLDECYRKKNHLITIDELNKISKKYNLSFKMLAILLDLDKEILLGYKQGNMPSLEHSYKLKRILQDPSYIQSLVVLHKIALNKDYDRIMKNVKKQMSINKSTLQDVIDYLLIQNRHLTPLVLQKALYYIQGFYYAFYDEFLFSEDFEAWVHGPVIVEVYHQYKKFTYHPIETKIESVYLNQQTQNLVDEVLKQICCYDGKILEEMTHLETPWKESHEQKLQKHLYHQVIPKDVLATYFKKIKYQYQIEVPSDIYCYIQKQYKKISNH